VQRMTEEPVDGRFLLEGAYSIVARPPARPGPRLIRLASSIVILLLSLGLWVAIWEGVTLVASAVPR
jgi:hypothetical protein